METQDASTADGTGSLRDVSELIRKHAEELAKLSGQLGAARRDSAIPPVGTAGPPPVHSDVRALFPRRDTAPGSMPVLAADAAVNADSLPVLNAFREFLEGERRRTRNRMFIIGGVLACVVVVLAGVAIAVGRHYLERTKTSLQAGQEQAVYAAQSAERGMERVSATSQRLERNLASERQRVSSLAVVASNLSATIRQERISSQVSQSEMAARMEKQMEEMSRLHEAMTQLEIENAMLQGTISELRSNASEKQADASSGRMESGMEEPAETGGEPLSEPIQNTDGAAAKMMLPYRLPDLRTVLVPSNATVRSKP